MSASYGIKADGYVRLSADDIERLMKHGRTHIVIGEWKDGTPAHLMLCCDLPPPPNNAKTEKEE